MNEMYVITDTEQFKRLHEGLSEINWTNYGELGKTDEGWRFYAIHLPAAVSMRVDLDDELQYYSIELAYGINKVRHLKKYSGNLKHADFTEGRELEKMLDGIKKLINSRS